MEIKTDCDDIRMEWADDIKIEVKAEDVKSEIEDGEGDDIKVEVKEEDTKTEVQDYKNQCKEENVKEHADDADLQVTYVSISKKRIPVKIEPGLDTSADAQSSRTGVGACDEVEESECKVTLITSCKYTCNWHRRLWGVESESN